MPADDSLDQAFMSQVVDAPVAAIALTGRVNDCQAARRSAGRESLLQQPQECFGNARADNPPEATVCPSRIRATASAAEHNLASLGVVIPTNLR